MTYNQRFGLHSSIAGFLIGFLLRYEMKQIPSVSARYASNGSSTTLNELGMRAMQERAFKRRGEQYLLIKSPPASGKSRALMFIALDKLHNQGLKQAIVVVPEKKRYVLTLDPKKYNLVNSLFSRLL